MVMILMSDATRMYKRDRLKVLVFTRDMLGLDYSNVIGKYNLPLVP